MKTIQITSRHAKLSDAVAAAGLDLSYNEALALQDIAGFDSDPRVLEAFVVPGKSHLPEARVLFIYQSDDIRLLNEYTPFHVTMDGSPFSLVVVKPDRLEVTEPMFRRTVRRQLRSVFGDDGLFTTLSQ